MKLTKGQQLYRRLKVTHLTIPVELLMQYADGELGSSEMILVATIEAMTDRINGVGCWASNRYLAKVMHVGRKHIEKMVSNLRNQNIIKNGREYKGKRTLLVNWKLKRPSRKNAGPPPAKMRDNNSNTTYYLKEIVCNTTKARSFEEHCAQHFKDAIHAQTRRVVKWNVKSQAKHIKTLLKRYKDKGEFLDVFEWYCNNLKRRDLPRCYSPQELSTRQKVWNWIEDKFEQHAPRQEDVIISADAKTLYGRLKGLNWPKGSKEQLLKLIQLSLDAYQVFRLRLHHYALSLKRGTNTRTRRPYEYVHYMNKILPQSMHYIEQWFRELNKQVQGWSNWQGDLFEHKWDVKHKRFLAYGRDITTRYGQPASSFDKLLETLYA